MPQVMKMHAELKKPIFPHSYMFGLFVVYWFVGIFVLIYTKQGDSVLWLNTFSNDRLDSFFIVVTMLGNGIFAFLVAFVLLFKKVYYAFVMGASLIFVSLFTNILKRLVFIQHYRPLWFLYYNDLHRVVIDAPVNYLRSFPSGHAMTAFAVATTLAILFRKRGLSIFFFISALLISWSRVYLCQHFFIDIFWGGILGFFSASAGKLFVDMSTRFFSRDLTDLPIQKVLPVLLSRAKH